MPTSEERLREVTIGEPRVLDGQVLLVDYDPSWPGLYEREAARIRAALAHRVVVLEHVGSTSVPGLAAKPKIDILLVVPCSADEAAYLPPLEAAGYVLKIREPDWYEHRVFGRPELEMNVHVFSPGCPEIDRMLTFRDRLRSNITDRERYENTKRELAARQWRYVQHYADAKSEIVESILAAARAG